MIMKLYKQITEIRIHAEKNCRKMMIIKLYKQMTEIRFHAEKNCRKILRPGDNLSPTIQMR